MKTYVPKVGAVIVCGVESQNHLVTKLIYDEQEALDWRFRVGNFLTVTELNDLYKFSTRDGWIWYVNKCDVM